MPTTRQLVTLAHHLPQILKRLFADLILVGRLPSRRLRSHCTSLVHRHQRQRQQCLIFHEPAQIQCAGSADHRLVAAGLVAALLRARPAPEIRRPATRRTGLHAALTGQHQRAVQLAIDGRCGRRTARNEATRRAPILASAPASRRRGKVRCGKLLLDLAPGPRADAASTTSHRRRQPGVATWGAYTSGDPPGCQKNKRP